MFVQFPHTLGHGVILGAVGPEEVWNHWERNKKSIDKGRKCEKSWKVLQNLGSNEGTERDPLNGSSTVLKH